MGESNSRGDGPSASHPITADIVAAVAEAEGADPVELTPPLYSVVDPDALDRLLRRSAGDVRVRFEYLDWTIDLRSADAPGADDPEERQSMYMCRCTTCDEKDLFDDLDAAQTSFNEHARQQHEVVLHRIVPPDNRLSVVSPETDPEEAPEEDTEP